MKRESLKECNFEERHLKMQAPFFALDIAKMGDVKEPFKNY